MQLSGVERLFQKVQNIYRLHEAVDHITADVARSGVRLSFDAALIRRLHAIAMEKLLDQPGAYRNGPVYLTNCPHVPPSWIDVDPHVEALCRYVNEKWDEKDLVHLAAFVLWRLNWIHPFPNGNGRTSRAVAYLVLSAKFGGVLPASKNSIIEQIVNNRPAYYAALRGCDTIYDQTKSLDACVLPLEQLLHKMLIEQLKASLA